MVSAASPQEYLRLWVYMSDLQPSRMDFYLLFSLYSRFGASRRPPLPMKMPTRRFLPAVNGSPPSTWCGKPSRFNVRETAWRGGWCRLTCAPAMGRMRACRVSKSTAPRQGHLIGTYSSIPMKRLPMPANSAAGMTRGSYSEPWRRPSSLSLLVGRPVSAGVPSPTTVPARLCGQHAFPG